MICQNLLIHEKVLFQLSRVLVLPLFLHPIWKYPNDTIRSFSLLKSVIHKRVGVNFQSIPQCFYRLLFAFSKSKKSNFESFSKEGLLFLLEHITIRH